MARRKPKSTIFRKEPSSANKKLFEKQLKLQSKASSRPKPPPLPQIQPDRTRPPRPQIQPDRTRPTNFGGLAGTGGKQPDRTRGGSLTIIKDPDRSRGGTIRPVKDPDRTRGGTIRPVRVKDPNRISFVSFGSSDFGITGDVKQKSQNQIRLEKAQALNRKKVKKVKKVGRGKGKGRGRKVGRNLTPRTPRRIGRPEGSFGSDFNIFRVGQDIAQTPTRTGARGGTRSSAKGRVITFDNLPVRRQAGGVSTTRQTLSERKSLTESSERRNSGTRGQKAFQARRKRQIAQRKRNREGEQLARSRQRDFGSDFDIFRF